MVLYRNFRSLPFWGLLGFLMRQLNFYFLATLLSAAKLRIGRSNHITVIDALAKSRTACSEIRSCSKLWDVISPYNSIGHQSACQQPKPSTTRHLPGKPQLVGWKSGQLTQIAAWKTSADSAFFWLGSQVLGLEILTYSTVMAWKISSDFSNVQVCSVCRSEMCGFGDPQAAKFNAKKCEV